MKSLKWCRILGPELFIEMNERTEKVIDSFVKDGMLNLLKMRYDMNGKVVEYDLKKTSKEFIFYLNYSNLEKVDVKRVMADILDDVTALLEEPSYGIYHVFFQIRLNIASSETQELLPIFRLVRVPSTGKNRGEAIIQGWWKLSEQLRIKNLGKHIVEIKQLHVQPTKEEWELFRKHPISTSRN